MRLLIYKKADDKRRERSVFWVMVLVLLAIVIPIFSGALVANGKVWAEEGRWDVSKLPPCDSGWKEIKEGDEYYCASTDSTLSSADGNLYFCLGKLSELTRTPYEGDSRRETISYKCDNSEIDGAYDRVFSVVALKSSEKGNAEESEDELHYPPCSVGLRGGSETDPETGKQYSYMTCDDPGWTYDSRENGDKKIPYCKKNLKEIETPDAYINPNTGQSSSVHYKQMYKCEDSGETYTIKFDVEPVTYENQDKEICFNNAGALGWIMCPVISAMSGLLSTVYEKIENDYLQIQANGIFSGDSDVYGAWDAFRNIANLAFIIIFLVVIFSQVTGVGIDNFGIKKIMPKLIIAAILINLSYVICQLAVDVSNIVGVGAKGLFDGIVPTTANSGGTYSASAGQYVVVLGGLGAVGLGVLFAAPGLILTVGLALGSAVLAVLFLYVILIARQAGVIILVAISPLAFACYILPNTDKLFKQWTSIAKGLLLLFPLCSLVIGGGSLAARILASVGDDTMKLAAIIVQVIPYFFIPTLLKGSLSALGNLGARIEGIGKAFSNATVGNFARSDTAKRWKTGLDNFDVGGVRGAVANSRFGRLTNFSKMRARQITAADKERQERLEAGRLLQADITDRAERLDPRSVTQDKIGERLNQAAIDGNQEKYFAILDDARRRFGDSAAAKMHRTAITEAGKDGVGLMSSGKKANFLRDSAERYGQFKAKDFSLGRYMESGGADKSGSLVTLAEFEEGKDGNKNIELGDLSNEDAATLNADSIERELKNGHVSQQQAANIMRNAELRRGMSEVQQLMWAQYAKTGRILSSDEAKKSLSDPNSKELLAPEPQRVQIVDPQKPQSPQQ